MPIVLLLLAVIAIDGTELDKAVNSVLPSREEDAYLSIAWRQNLPAARAEAQEQNKPLFLWIMNGHPLGCT